MKKLILLICLFGFFDLHAQQLSNTLLGYQEPNTQIKAITKDDNGQIYYIGIFRGQLIVNNQILLQGNGGDDIFLVKTSPTGTVIWAKKYGGLGNEIVSTPNMLRYSNGGIFFANFITYPTDIGGNIIQPYAFDRPATCITKVDTTNGNVLWVKRTSLVLANLQVNGNTIIGIGTHGGNRGNVIFENQSLIDSASLNGNKSVVLVIGQDGSYKTVKTMFYRMLNLGTNQGVNPQSILFSNSGQLYFTCRINSGSQGTSLYFQDSLVNLAAMQSAFYLVKTDTGFRNLRYKQLNTGNTIPYIQSNNYNSIATNNSFDSLYILLSAPGAAANYTLDGFNVVMTQKNNLVVMDSNLVTARVKNINSTSVNSVTNKLILNSIHYYNGSLYYIGTFNGTNEAPPINPIPRNTQYADLIAGFADTVDMNGPSRSYMAKSNLDLSIRTRKWLGSSVGYEGSSINTGSMISGNGNIYFNNTADDLWNRWVIDSSMNILSGGMITSSDRGEYTQKVEYFNDGSRFVVGFARGKTALDTSNANIVNSASRQDLFFVKIGTQDSIRWYKRVFSSFRNGTIRKVVMKNNRAYVLVSFGSNTNSAGFNYIKIDTSTLTVNPLVYYTLFIFNSDGTCKMLPVSETIIGQIANFNVLPSGDLLVSNETSSASISFNGNTYPSGIGAYVGRMNENGIFLDLIKCYSTSGINSFRVNDLQTHADGSFSMLATGNLSTGQHLKLKITNGGSFNDSLQFLNPEGETGVSRQYGYLIRTGFNAAQYLTGFGPVSSMIPGNSVLVDNKLYLQFYRSGLKDSFYVNNQLIFNDTSYFMYGLLGLNNSGTYLANKRSSGADQYTFPAINFQKLSSHGGYLYASGTLTKSVTVDTISLNYAGSGDAITLKLDTSLVAKRAFRLSTIYSESMYDCAVYNDSLISFAYTAQTTPDYTNNRTTIDPADLDENAYVGTILLNKPINNNPVQIGLMKAWPNPLVQSTIYLDLGTAPAGKYSWSIYNMAAATMQSGQLNWTRAPASIQFSRYVPAGVYFLVLRSDDGNTTRKAKMIISRNY